MKQDRLDSKMLAALLTGVNRAFPFMTGKSSLSLFLSFSLFTQCILLSKYVYSLSHSSFNTHCVSYITSLEC